MQLLPIVLLVLPVADAGHNQANPVYRQLVAEGVELPGGRRVRLPQPTIVDGIDAAAARAALEAVPGRRASVDQLLRKSSVAPVTLTFRQIDSPDGEESDANVRLFGVDVWFVAYGSLQTLTEKSFLDRRFEAGRGDAQVRQLGAEDLQRRNIRQASDAERYVHAVFGLLDRIELSVTSQAYLSRTDESLLAAARVDPRFAADDEFPNRWRRLVRKSDGSLEPGTAAAVAASSARGLPRCVAGSAGGASWSPMSNPAFAMSARRWPSDPGLTTIHP